MKRIHQLMTTALLMTDIFSVNTEEWKDRIRAEWEESKNFPRKKKKQTRKRLLLEWGCACYDPFEGIYKL